MIAMVTSIGLSCHHLYVVSNNASHNQYFLNMIGLSSCLGLLICGVRVGLTSGFSAVG